ncbi:MAG: hypothetical protein O7B26_07155, partial [Planctomycetota bacterium]|nr:hypothetical protein [Planctomycetota bacterium]
MARRNDTKIDGLTAPEHDGTPLIVPAADTLAQLIEHNRALKRSYTFEVCGRPATDFDGSDREPVIMTGHQPDFLHPGVWAKNVVGGRLAAKVGGRADFLVVDSDAPQEVSLQWPHVDGDRWRVLRRVILDNSRGLPFEHLPRQSMDRWVSVLKGLPDSIRLSGEGVLPAFESGFSRCADGANELDYVDAWIAGMRAIDAHLGPASPTFRRVGRLFSGREESAGQSATFIAHAMLNAASFSAAYNASLAGYRRRRRIRGTHHPIPDLLIEGDRWELPFWVGSDVSPRQRMWVWRSGDDAIAIGSGHETFGVIPEADLRARPWAALTEGLPGRHIRPRALTLTMYARLFACDVFIHGIGGAKYDQITDDVIRRFFGVEPPAYACVSATLHLPLPRSRPQNRDTGYWVRRLRDARFNPQRYVDDRGAA